MAFYLRLRPPLVHHFNFTARPIGIRKLSIRNCALPPHDAHKLVVEVKEKLEKEYNSLPAGKNGRDDEELILWFLKDRKFSVEDAVSKLSKAIRWYHEFGVSELSEESVRSVAESGKSYVHDYLDVNDRPVLIVEVAKHFPGFDVFYNYYPKRLGEVLFVDAPFIFQPIWQLVKPMLKSYASLVRFCSAEVARDEYFTYETVPANLRK